MGAACLINSRDDLPCFEHSLDFGKLDCVFFFPSMVDVKRTRRV